MNWFLWASYLSRGSRAPGSDCFSRITSPGTDDFLLSNRWFQVVDTLAEKSAWTLSKLPLSYFWLHSRQSWQVVPPLLSTCDPLADWSGFSIKGLLDNSISKVDTIVILAIMTGCWNQFTMKTQYHLTVRLPSYHSTAWLWVYTINLPCWWEMMREWKASLHVIIWVSLSLHVAR